jgi:murein DD-endopeptidase MepM/ murein hydrolase activator NlpD
MHVRSVGRLVALSLTIAISVSCHSGRSVIHRVEEGESLTMIAHVYDVPVRELLQANPRLSSDELPAGEKILVPGAPERRRALPVVWEMEEVEREASPEPVPSPTSIPSVPLKKTAPPRKTRSVQVAPKKALEFSWPATGKLVSRYGVRDRKMHNGIDIKTSPGVEIVAAADGTVVYVGSEVEGYGNLLIVRHPTNLFSVYAYVGTILAKKGDAVARGDVIARAHSRGAEAFLHFELRRGKQALDPLTVLPKTGVR